MSSSMKSSNEYQLYEALGPIQEDPKWTKRGSNQKMKEMPYTRGEEKGNEYADQQQLQKLSTKKNYPSYSNKNQEEDYSKGNVGVKGNNQSPPYKKNSKGKKDNYGDYQGNNTIDDGINEKDDYSLKKKKDNPQGYSNKEIVGYNQKLKHNPNGQNGLSLQIQPGTWDNNQNAHGNYQQLGQISQRQPQMPGYYDKGNFGVNSYQNHYQIQQFNQPGPMQGPTQGPNPGQFGYRNQYSGEQKVNMSMPNMQGKSVNNINSNVFHINSNPIPQNNITYSNTEGNRHSNVSSSHHQEKDASSEGDDNYLLQQRQYSLKPGYTQDHMENNSYGQNLNDQMLSNQINPSYSMLNPNAPPIQSFQNINRNYQQEMYFQQQMQGQGNPYIANPQMFKGMNRVPNMGIINMQQIDPHNPMYPMSQVPYGMNHINNGGGMVKTKKKSSKKISQYPQDGQNSNNNKNSMKMHYNNNGKYYKGSHSTQGVKNTIPNCSGGNLSFMNMNNNIGLPSSPPMGINPSMPPQQMPTYSFINNQGTSKPFYKQKRNMNNPYRSVISDKTVGASGGNVSLTKPKQNDYYNKPQSPYYNYDNPQSLQKYQPKSEELSNLETDYNASGIGSLQESVDLYQKQSANLNNNVSLFIKVKLEDDKEIVVDLKKNKNPMTVTEALKGYNITDNQLTYIFYKIVEALNLSEKILHVPLGPFDQKQLLNYNKVISEIGNQIQITHKPNPNKRFPIIHLENYDNSFSYESTVYESLLIPNKPDYTDIKEYDLLNKTQ